MRAPARSFALPSSSVHPGRQYFDRVEGMSAKSLCRCTLMTVCQQTADPSRQSAGDYSDYGFLEARAGGDFKRNSAPANFIGSAAAVAGHSMFSPPHRDAVTDLKITRSEEHSLLLSSGRDGVVNVWKADYLSGSGRKR
jgi:hypothetical protein